MLFKQCFFWCCGLFLISLIYHFGGLFIEYVMYHQQHIVDGYFVNTSSCRILTILPHRQDINRMWRGVSKDLCVGHQPIVFGTSDQLNNYLVTQIAKEAFNVSNTSMFNCKYHVIERCTDYTNKRIDSIKFEMAKHLKLKINADFVHTECKLNQSIVYENVNYFLRRPQTIIKKDPFLPLGALQKSERLSVMIIGLDSVSHMHFLRSMSRTMNFINTLSHVEFMGFNRVGGNSFENLIPLLTGLSSSELKTACLDFKGFDSCRFIWQNFKEAGYKTSFGEDEAEFGIFTGGKPGFYRQPTDHYLRPSLLQMWKRSRKGINSGTPCNPMNSYATILRDFVYQLVPHLRQDNFFTFLWWTQGIHSLFNYARKLDSMLLEMFEYLLTEGVFNKTIIVIMSNNGLQSKSTYNTHQGLLEENQPVLFICYPKWLKHKYPLAIRNLEMNDKSLITAYDVHATLLDLSNIPITLNNDQVRYRNEKLSFLSVAGGDGGDLPRGISLFLTIPGRNCELAHIPQQFCSCHTESMASFSDKRILQGARLLLRTINDILKPRIPPCHYLRMNRVVHASIWNRQNDAEQFEVVVQVETLPGYGQFKGIIRITGFSMALNGPILRCNQISNNSRCVRNYLIEMFCHCH